MHDERQDQIMRNYLTGNVPTGPGYLAWLLGLGFTQQQFTSSGFAVDVTDSGIDNATTSPNHFALYVEGVRPGTSRVIYNRLEGTPELRQHPPGLRRPRHPERPHRRRLQQPDRRLPRGRLRLPLRPGRLPLGQGRLLGHLRSGFLHDPELPNLQSKAYNDGARISTNSWGAAVGGAYNSDSQAYDALVRDAQPTAPPTPWPATRRW